MIHFSLIKTSRQCIKYNSTNITGYNFQKFCNTYYHYITRNYCDFYSYRRISKKKVKDPLSKRIQDFTTSGLIKTANHIQVNNDKDKEEVNGEDKVSGNNSIDTHSEKFLKLCEKLKIDKANNAGVSKPLKVSKLLSNKSNESKVKEVEEAKEENVYEKHGYINFEDSFDLSHYYVEEVEVSEDIDQFTNKIELIDINKYQYNIDKDRRKIQTKVDIISSNLKKTDSSRLSEEELQFWRGSFPWNRRVNKINKEVFGHDKFRPYQKEAINLSNMRKNLFISLATGGGKSLCYQIPCLLEKGSTIIVSPLISLIEDQVNSLLQKGLPAIGISSHTQPHELNRLYQSMKEDHFPYKFVFITPERIVQSSKFMEALRIMDKKKNLQRFVIDEAHCISEWGHDFRRDYRKLTTLKEEFPLIPITALSASCTPIVQQDVLQQLSIENDVCILQDSFNRPNLWIQIERKTPDYMNDIYNYIVNSGYKNSSGIVFALTCGDAERISSFLLEKGIKSIHYHGNLSPLERKKNQSLWMNDEVNVICTTIAFGLGIDKKNVRYVIHSTMPTSIESYYQQIGRAGRDGQNSDCILFYSRNDRTRIEKIIKLNTLSLSNDISKQKYSEDDDVTIVEECNDDFEDELIDYEVSAMKSEKLDDISFFCQIKNDCRRNVLLEYFGELCSTTCGNCDVCKPKERRKVKSNTKNVLSKDEIDDIVRKISSNTRFKTSIPLNDASSIKNSESVQSLEEEDEETSNQDSLYAKIAQIIKIKEERKREKELKKSFPSGSSIKPKLSTAKRHPIDDYSSTEESNNIIVSLYKMCEDFAAEKGISPRHVLSHQLIKDIAYIKPKTMSELKSIRGIGTKKAMLYGNEILAIVTNNM